jgi:hypothetical protein
MTRSDAKSNHLTVLIGCFSFRIHLYIYFDLFFFSEVELGIIEPIAFDVCDCRRRPWKSRQTHKCCTFVLFGVVQLHLFGGESYIAISPLFFSFFTFLSYPSAKVISRLDLYRVISLFNFCLIGELVLVGEDLNVLILFLSHLSNDETRIFSLSFFF